MTEYSSTPELRFQRGEDLGGKVHSKCYRHNKWGLKGGQGGRNTTPHLKFPIHHPILFPVSRLLSPSSLKPLLFLLPPLLFLVWSKSIMEHNLIPDYGAGSVTTTVVIPLGTKGMQAGEVKQGQTKTTRGRCRNSWRSDYSTPTLLWEHELDWNNWGAVLASGQDRNKWLERGGNKTVNLSMVSKE